MLFCTRLSCGILSLVGSHKDTQQTGVETNRKSIAGSSVACKPMDGYWVIGILRFKLFTPSFWDAHESLLPWSVHLDFMFHNIRVKCDSFQTERPVGFRQRSQPSKIPILLLTCSPGNHKFKSYRSRFMRFSHFFHVILVYHIWMWFQMNCALEGIW